jgi:hypothetical protein
MILSGKLEDLWDDTYLETEGGLWDNTHRETGGFVR